MPPLPLSISQLLLLSRHHTVWNIAVVSLGQVPWLCPLQDLAHPQPTGEGDVGETALLCASTAQQQPQPWCVTSTLLATDAQHSTVGAAEERINSCSARHNTTSNKYVSLEDTVGKQNKKNETSPSWSQQDELELLWAVAAVQNRR